MAWNRAVTCEILHRCPCEDGQASKDEGGQDTGKQEALPCEQCTVEAEHDTLWL